MIWTHISWKQIECTFRTHHSKTSLSNKIPQGPWSMRKIKRVVRKILKLGCQRKRLSCLMSTKARETIADISMIAVWFGSVPSNLHAKLCGSHRSTGVSRSNSELLRIDRLLRSVGSYCHVPTKTDRAYILQVPNPSLPVELRTKLIFKGIQQFEISVSLPQEDNPSERIIGG